MTILFLLIFVFCSNSFILLQSEPLWLLAVLPVLFAVNIFTGFTSRRIPGFRLKLCNHGAWCLVIFSVSVIVSGVYHILGIFLLDWKWKTLIFSVLVSYFCHLILFWNGIISVYCTSGQLGIKKRVIGALVGMIPVAHLFALHNIIVTTLREVRLETDKYQLNLKRKNEQICKTKYPLLMVHGVFFRDTKLFNYWGRIPSELETNGAKIYYGEHQSALSIEDSARELAERIKTVVDETGCGKLNIIAHSKGGLDCRYAIEHFGVAEYVASLTTINTPHRGCGFADFLLDKLPESVQNKVADTYNSAAKKLGDSTPDFMAAVNDLRADNCKALDKALPMPEGIYTRSVGSVLNKASSGQFPLNYSYHLVKFFDGKNDGLVSEDSFKWGDDYTLITHDGDRGISHGDMIDLNRENIHGFDVREFYVELVSDLKKRGF
ncbi:MAG: alpha/beta fold hydrolase [Clostridia bacterium]|nr:alpha/beta fold hydrolase [Clostridia bacterium]